MGLVWHFTLLLGGALMNSLRSLGLTAVTMTGMSVALLAPCRAAVYMTIEAPGVAASQVPDVTVDGFESRSPGPLESGDGALGSYFASSADVIVQSADQYGGAGGTGQFVTAFYGSVFDVQFAAPQAYVGLWWCSMDLGDILNVVELTTSAGDIFNFHHGTILASGQLQLGHYGNPFPPYEGFNAAEPYAYVNFFASNESSKFTRLRLGNGNFEVDNLSAQTALTPTRGALIEAQGVPEPSAVVLAVAGLVALDRRRRRVARIGFCDCD
jgi:hypothetical protein